jgi:two-component system, chemotaxis family, protein-glutamate methylesterase/glutaminase
MSQLGAATGAARGAEDPEHGRRQYELICIGASWGGLHAVGHVLRHIPKELEQPIVVGQHRHPDSHERTLPELLGLQIPRPVLEAEDKLAIEPCHVYVAPRDYHLLVERGSFALSVDERVQYARPSIDVLFETAADAYGAGVIGIILTGANEDGAAGLRRIKEVGGVAIIQDPRDAERRIMPDAAVAATAADAVLPLDEIGKFVYGLCMEPAVQRPVSDGQVERVLEGRGVPPRAGSRT